MSLQYYTYINQDEFETRLIIMSKVHQMLIDAHRNVHGQANILFLNYRRYDLCPHCDLENQFGNYEIEECLNFKVPIPRGTHYMETILAVDPATKTLKHKLGSGVFRDLDFFVL